MDQSISSWWGRHALAADRTDFWQIGPLKMWLGSSASKLGINWAHTDNFLDGHVRTVAGAQAQLEQNITAPAQTESVTCAFATAYREQTRNEIVFSPTLPDRPVVLRLQEPLHVLPSEEVTVYMVVPVFLRLELASGSKLIHELPTYRLSDTWFGPMSTLGGLCYASASPAYFDIREVPLRSHCAITAITVKNLGQDVLKVERLNVPFPRLSLFYSQRTGFWTDHLTLERSLDTEMASLRLDRQPPPEASPTQFVVGPREVAHESHSVFRAFSAIFKEGKQAQ